MEDEPPSASDASAESILSDAERASFNGDVKKFCEKMRIFKNNLDLGTMRKWDEQDGSVSCLG